MDIIFMKRLPGIVVFFLVAACADRAPESRALPAAEGSWLHLQTTVATPDGRTSALQLIDDFGIDEIDTSAAIELPGNARVFADGSSLFTGGAEEPIIQQWIPHEDGTLGPGERLQLSNLGLTAVPYGHNFVAPDKAYLFEGSLLAAVVWDPSTLTVTGEIDLSSLMSDGMLPTLDPGVLRGDRLFVLVQLFDFVTGDLYRGTRVAVIDTRTDTVEAVLSDERCVGGLTPLRLGDDGTIYVMGDNYLFLHWFDDELPPTCVLRIPPGERSFDPDWSLDLEAITGHPTTGLVHHDGALYTQAMDASLGQADPAVETLTFLNEPVSRWWRIPLDDLDAAAPLDGIGPVSPRSGGAFEVDGDIYVQGASDGFIGETRLYRLDGGRGTEMFRYTGLIANLGRTTVDGDPP